MSSSRLSFQHIGLFGYSVGSLNFLEDGLEWRDRNNLVKSFDKENISHGTWAIFGSKGHLKFYLSDGKIIRFDGFTKADKESIMKFTERLGLMIEDEVVSTEGNNFGEVIIDEKKMYMLGPSGKQAFEIRIDNISNCMMADKNGNEVEIQFHETDTGARDEDALVQIRFHFPSTQAENDEITLAEEFQRNIEKTITHSVTGHIIVEFTSEEGTFITPRGRYGIQMYSDFLRMHGAKYDYKIQYSDIDKLFLLPKPDGQHQAFVICLEKPIRQGNQRYQHLVLQAHMQDHTITVNLSEEELLSRYEGQLTREITMPLSNLYAKVFKIISGSKVFIPKNFKSDRDTNCVKCSLKANEGYLYPLEKSFVFINKPTIFISFEDIESVEFQRYKAAATSATRNFDLVVIIKQTAVTSEGKEFAFSGIDRSEYNTLYQFLNSKKLRIRNIDESAQTSSLLDRLKEELGGDVDEDDEDDEDSDFEENKDDDDSGDDSGDDDEEDEDEEPIKEKSRSKEKEKSSTPKKKIVKAKDDDQDDEDEDEEKPVKLKTKGKAKESDPDAGDKRKRTPGKKDKNAPKKARTAYTYFLDAKRATVKDENPNANFGELSKLVGDLWKNLSAEDKAHYEGLARKDKDRYEKDMSDYVPPDDEDDSKGKKKKKAKKDKNAPKGFQTAYLLYSSDQRKALKEKNPELTIGEMSKMIGISWKTVSAEDKAVYEEKSKKDKQRYTEELATYKSSQGTPAAGKMDVEADDDDAGDVEEEDDEGDGDEDEDDDE